MTLPPYATTAEGRALIAQVIAERPDYRITSGAWIEGGGHRRYYGHTAKAIRRLYKAWFEREDAELVARFADTGVWDQPAANEVYRCEDGDELIERVLRECDLMLTEVVQGDPFGTRFAA